MNQKRTNTKRTGRHLPPPEVKQQRVAELTDADLEQVQGGQGLTSVPGENYKLK